MSPMKSKLTCRQVARRAIQNSVPREIWSKNWQFIERLRIEISKYSMLNHPFIEMLNGKQLTKAELKEVLLNFRPIVVGFTDVLLKFAALTCQVEDRVASGAKMHSRFLITLNILDELGFSPDVDHEGYYQGSPFNSHYLYCSKTFP